MTVKQSIQEYIKDQISFYENRKKKILKNIKDKERVGLPVTALDKFQVVVENKHIKEFENAQTMLSFQTDNDIETYLNSLEIK